jgi:hypothetical protein
MNECNDGKGDNGKAYDEKKQQMVGMYVKESQQAVQEAKMTYKY